MGNLDLAMWDTQQCIVYEKIVDYYVVLMAVVSLTIDGQRKYIYVYVSSLWHFSLRWNFIKTLFFCVEISLKTFSLEIDYITLELD